MARPPRSHQKMASHTTEYGTRHSQALRHAREVTDDYLLHHSADVIVESLVTEHAPENVVIDFDQPEVNQEPPLARGRPGGDPEIELVVYFNARGCTGALWNRGLPISMRAQEGSLTRIRFTAMLDDKAMGNLSPDALKEAVDSVTAQLRQLATTVNGEIVAHRERLRREISQIIEPKWQRLRAFQQAADVIGIPVTPRGDTNLIPLQPRKVTLRSLDDALSRGTPEWQLEEDIAEDILKTTMSFNSALERLTATADKLAAEDEVTIRDLLLFILNAHYQGLATGETFVGIGKADIVLRWQDRDAFIGECKFWRGSATFTNAINQLLGRYTVWRQTRVALILFIRDPDVTTIIEKASNCIIEHERFMMPITPTEPDRRRDYLLRTTGDEQRQVRLVFLPVVIPQPLPI